MTDHAQAAPAQDGVSQILSRAGQWARANLFNTITNTVITLLILFMLVRTVPAILDWMLFSATWSGTAETCRAAGGACWAFIDEKYRIMFFGLYPNDQHWRPFIAMVLFFGLVGVSAKRSWWGPNILYMWAVGVPVLVWLMWGGFLGLTYVDHSQFGGLPLTLGMASIGLLAAFPIGVLLALGRTSSLPVIKGFSILYIEAIRGVPLITLLIMSSVVFPLFLPEGLNPDKLLRAQVAIIMFAAAYIAEVVRGGLQSVPKGQYEAADSLGLTYWRKMGLVILPQALKVSIPGLVNTFIGFFKDTSLVIAIGLFELVNATRKLAMTDRAWLGMYMEAYFVVSMVFLVLCYAMSKYSQDLEKELNKSNQR